MLSPAHVELIFYTSIVKQRFHHLCAIQREYVFVSTADEKEVARLQFQSRAKVAANRSLTLIGKSLERPPYPTVVTAEKLEKEGEFPYRERVEIKCVLYADGTWGRLHKVLESDCESLARGKQRKAN